MGLEVVNEAGEVLLNLPVEVGRADLTATGGGGYTTSQAYNIGPGEGQYTSLRIVVSELDAPAERLKEFVLQPIDWDGFTKEQLEANLRRHELEVSGTKDELIERLDEAGIRPIGAV
jgi:hypothetical protein